jgi:hypothetical protein
MKKQELLQKIEEQHEIFSSIIEDLDESTLQLPGVIGTWSIKDILTHISRWEAELIKLLWQVRQGQKPTTAHFSGIPVDKINEQFFDESHPRPLKMVLEDYYSVRSQTLLRIETFTDQELDDSTRYRWQKGIPLWQWIASDTYEHEAEHLESIKAWLKVNPTHTQENSDAS